MILYSRCGLTDHNVLGQGIQVEPQADYIHDAMLYP